ncbi:MAG: response regulator [Candidatus Pacebacteria bacterium]|nr:response regulator [Candidatus Paceibacterota bacterium]
MNKKGLLLVEDDREFAGELLECLGSLGIACHYAEDVAKARNIFGENPNISIILMDRDLKGGGDTLVLTQEFLASRKVFIIAISNSEQGRKELVDAGCSCQCSKDKIFNLLDLIQKNTEEKGEAT